MAPTESSRAKDHREKEAAAQNAAKQQKPAPIRASTSSTNADRSTTSKPASKVIGNGTTRTGVSRTASSATRTAPRSSSTKARTSVSKESASDGANKVKSSSGSFLDRMMRPTASSKAHQLASDQSDGKVKRTGSIIRKKVAQVQDKVTNRVDKPHRDEPMASRPAPEPTVGGTSEGQALSTRPTEATDDQSTEISDKPKLAAEPEGNTAVVPEQS